MDRKNENFLDMADVTLGVLENYKHIWTTAPPMVAVVNEAKAARQSIGNAVQGQQTRTTGITEDKEALSDEAIRQGIRLARLVQAYALDRDDRALFRQMQLSESTLDRTADVELIEILRDLHGRVAVLGTAVQPYGITSGLLMTFDNAISAFRDANPSPRGAVVERVTHTESIPAQLRVMRMAFQKLDRLVLIFEEEVPEFVSNYRNARVIINRRGPGSDKDPEEEEDKKKGDAPTAETKKA